VEDEEEVLKLSEALEVQTIKIETAKNKAHIVTHMMKDEFFNN